MNSEKGSCTAYTATTSTHGMKVWKTDELQLMFHMTLYELLHHIFYFIHTVYCAITMCIAIDMDIFKVGVAGLILVENTLPVKGLYRNCS